VGTGTAHVASIRLNINDIDIKISWMDMVVAGADDTICGVMR
jgi:hypothetical protein